MTPLVFAVVGDPVAHSKSPAMHEAAYRALGLPHRYEAVRAGAGELPGVLQALREGRYGGLNVTVPHKQRVLELVDEVAPSAREVGAANTIVRDPGGRLVAHNTDAPALVQELRALATPDDLRGKPALVLGSGGAARAARVALEALGMQVRARSRAEGTLAPSPDDEGRTFAIVQATSAGMTGADPGDGVAGAVAWASVPEGAIALDVVYSPATTPFLGAALARGLRAANGLGMLARQGALAFELWLGIPAPLDAMRAGLTGQLG